MPLLKVASTVPDFKTPVASDIVFCQVSADIVLCQGHNKLETHLKDDEF